MDKIPLEPGRVVLSKAGRDAGRRFVVLRVDDTFAYIADGDLRKAQAPKKKKRKHLRALPARCDSVADAALGGQGPTDADLRRCLADSDRP